MHRFLSAPGALPSETRVQLIDSIDNELRIKSFPNLFIRDALLEELARRPAHATTRIVYVSYPETWSIDRDVVEVIGYHFRVNPLFFWGHMHHCYSSKDRLCPSDLRGIRKVKQYWIAPLPSERISLELICLDSGISVLFLDGNGSTEEGNTGKQPSASVPSYPVRLTHCIDISYHVLSRRYTLDIWIVKGTEQ